MSEVISRREPSVWVLWHDAEKPTPAPHQLGENLCCYMAERYGNKCIFFLATEEEMGQPPYFPVEMIEVEYIIQCDDDPEFGWTDEVNISDYHGIGYTSPTEYFESWTRDYDRCSYRLITRTTRSNVTEEIVKVKIANGRGVPNNKQFGRKECSNE